MNREFRKRYGKGTDFNPVTKQEINLVVYIINEKLKPVLNWRTAKEMFLENFK
ncbi:MAG: hypothetical protein OHM56_07280 [Spiroplasma phoeniceum]|nr:MAG: hypothetical protein OHM57_06680 [Spiroplasma phoeniceum]UZQ31442.1 MAG: hypothetical protein OHM56_07280 [Spiroplasma phoeniceum]